ncbi:hypothetical protein B0T21DRAFT_415281 [Apiosordaria backusii]|uniref:Uncharacterized protein n=1 Tax=Apiosordaria backusii TaxID=314023 RepID=A0AA40AIP7_9PEZI|nr:hypothetical protein B0T21DRAFT_415281 [Apiosordaria backusii]
MGNLFCGPAAGRKATSGRPSISTNTNRNNHTSRSTGNHRRHTSRDHGNANRDQGNTRTRRVSIQHHQASHSRLTSDFALANKSSESVASTNSSESDDNDNDVASIGTSHSTDTSGRCSIPTEFTRERTTSSTAIRPDGFTRQRRRSSLTVRPDKVMIMTDEIRAIVKRGGNQRRL